MLRRVRGSIAVLFLLAAWIPQAGRADPAYVNPDAWYGRMRQPWTPQAHGFIREWLILGEFPKPTLENGKNQGQAASAAGCDTDYLAEHGGETRIQPTEGMAHTRPDGSTATWFRYQSDANVIDLKKILGGRPTDNAIAYAFTTMHREVAGPATLGVGSDDGVMIWVNGKIVHRHIVGRAVKIDDDRVAVDFKQGENNLLLKIENGTSGWGFACRVLEDAAQAILPRTDFEPSLQGDPNAKELIVQTDRTSDK